MTDDTPDWSLLDRYLAGELTPAERDRFEQWVARSADRRAWVESLRCITHDTGALPPWFTPGTDAAWVRASRRLGVGRVAAVVDLSSVRARQTPHASVARAAVGVAADRRRSLTARRHATTRPALSTRWVSTAAGLALAAGLAWTALALLRPPARAELPRRYATAAGEGATLTLSDGTALALGPATVLTVAAGYGHTTRTVTLDGEASFTVTHDDRHPFTVRTSWATLQDVGTTFIVRAYRDDRSTRIAVAAGAVSVRAIGGGRAVTLGAREGGLVDRTGDVVRGPIAQADALLAWLHGTLAFTDVPLADAIRDIARAYDLDIAVTDSSLARLPLTASFTDQPIDVVLGDIVAVVGARYHRSGRRVVIRPRRAGPGHWHRALSSSALGASAPDATTGVHRVP